MISLDFALGFKCVRGMTLFDHMNSLSKIFIKTKICPSMPLSDKKLRLNCARRQVFVLWPYVSLFNYVLFASSVMCISNPWPSDTPNTQCSWAQYYLFSSLKVQNQNQTQTNSRFFPHDCLFPNSQVSKLNGMLGFCQDSSRNEYFLYHKT